MHSWISISTAGNQQRIEADDHTGPLDRRIDRVKLSSKGSSASDCRAMDGEGERRAFLGFV
jgi:hypothetical protein